MNVIEKSFKNYQTILDIINNNKNEDGIAYLDRQYIDDKMKLSRTMTNRIIKNINLYGVVIKKVDGGYTTDYKNIFEIEWIKKIIIMLCDTMIDPTIVRKTDNELMKKYCIDRKLVQKYRSYALLGLRY